MTGPLLPGDPAALGSVRLLARLGAGGMGRVYLGRTEGGRLVAVKTVHAHLAADPHFRERFRREAAAARAVTGAHTAAVLDADPDSPVPWLATAYLPGVTLRRAVTATGPLGEAAVRSLGAALAEALTAIHGAGLVHRDLKPSNVLLTAGGPRVIDFGIARALGDHGMTEAGDIIGTPGFIAPEQITDSAPVSAAADVFALGAVLAYAATGRNPFGDGTVAILLYRAVHEEPDLTAVPGGTRELVAGCLRKEPGRRPSVAEVLERTADPGAPLWWREEPLRGLVEGADDDRPREHTAVVPTRPVTVAPAPRDAPRPNAGTDRADAHRARTERARRDEWRDERRRVRRRELARRGVLLTGATTLTGLLGASVVRGWGDPGGTPANTGDSAGPTLKGGSAKPGALRWSLTADAGAVDALLLSGSTLLLHSSLTGETTGHVRACATSDGSRRWQLSASARAPDRWGTVDGNLVAPDLGLPVVDIGSGKSRVTDDPTRGLLPEWTAVVDGALVSSYENDEDANELEAVDLRTGKRRWGQELGGLRPPAVLGRTMLLAATLGGRVLGVDARSAKTLWSYEGLYEGLKDGVRSGGDEALAVAALPDAGNFALLTSAGRLHLIRARGGEPVAVASEVYAVTPGATALGAAGGTGLLATAGSLRGFDPGTGRPRWTRPTLGVETGWPSGPGGLLGPVTAGALVLHWATADSLQALDTRTGEPRWTRRLTGVAKVPPVVVGATVYAASGDTCSALRLADGGPLRTWTLPGIIDGLAADASGWYGRIGTSAVRAYNGVDG